MMQHSGTVSDKVVAITGGDVVARAAAHTIGQLGGVDVGEIVVRPNSQH